LRFNVEEATWIPEETKQRLKEQQANRITKEGELIITSTVHRTQHGNYFFQDKPSENNSFLFEQMSKNALLNYKSFSTKLLNLPTLERKQNHLHTLKRTE
jgi:hypothetical protein